MELNKTQISATVIADSRSPQGDRITTMVITFPRIILAEFNTHRMFSRNSASSRAIPFDKMVKAVKENPFIPIAWQKNHPGMQGTEYLDAGLTYNPVFFINSLESTLKSMLDKESKEYKKLEEEIKEKVLIIEELLTQYKGQHKTLNEWWLFARDKAVEAAALIYVFRGTKQLCNRLLEPFMWHTVIVTATEWENFFALRCPRYTINDKVFRSKKDALGDIRDVLGESDFENTSDYLQWATINEGQAEIHMMALAEAMWDAYNESTPKELKAGEWHIPFGDNIGIRGLRTQVFKGYLEDSDLELIQNSKIKIATAMCARVSYTVVGEESKEPNYENDIKLHDRLAKSGHWSPFEHCAKSMKGDEYMTNVRGKAEFTEENELIIDSESEGWSGNFKGFIQYRKLFDNENIK